MKVEQLKVIIKEVIEESIISDPNSKIADYVKAIVVEALSSIQVNVTLPEFINNNNSTDVLPNNNNNSKTSTLKSVLSMFSDDGNGSYNQSTSPENYFNSANKVQDKRSIIKSPVGNDTAKLALGDDKKIDIKYNQINRAMNSLISSGNIHIPDDTGRPE